MEINDKVNFSDTMNLPKNTIRTNAKLTTKESFFLARMQEIRRYREIVSKNKSSNVIYNVLESPTELSGKVDPTYIQNKILKDTVIRYRLLNGCKVRHNVNFVEKYNDTNEDNIQNVKLKNLQIQKVNDLGTVINYNSSSSLTAKDNMNSLIIDEFFKLYKSGNIYHDLGLTNWCPSCKENIENGSIEEKEQKENALFLTFNVSSDKGIFDGLGGLENVFFVVNVIKPWILDFESVLVVVPDLEYSVVEVRQNNKDIYYVMASEFVDYIMETSFFIKYSVRKRLLGKELVGIVCKNVLDNTKDLSVISTKREYVIFDDKHSSGILVISSGNSYNDYLVARENFNINIRNNLTKDAKTTEFAYNFKGIDYKESNNKILDILKQKNKILCTDELNIRESKCPKCNGDIIYMNEPKWYLKKENKEDNLKQTFDIIVNKVECNETDKESVKESLYGSIKNDKVVISKEDNGNIPIPILYCTNCSNELITEQSINVIKEILNTKSIEDFNNDNLEVLLQGKVVCDKCGCSKFTKEKFMLNDVLKQISLPITKGKVDNNQDQNINEINICIENKQEFVNKLKILSFDKDKLEDLENVDRILLHPRAKVINETIIKKSENAKVVNGSDINKIIKKYGIDILRVWCIKSSNDKISLLSDSRMLRVNKEYRELRTVIKFLLSNLYDFNPVKNTIPIENRDDLDKYMYIKLLELKKILCKNYNELKLHEMYLNIYKFCKDTLSIKYFNVIKYRLYVLNANDKKRRSTQSTLYEIFMTLLNFLGPIIPCTFEETWSYIWHTNSGEENNLMLYRNDIQQVNVQDYEKSIKKWNNIFFIIKRVNKQINKEIKDKKIKNSLQAKVILGVNENTKKFIDNNHEDFTRALNVSVLITELSERSHIKIEKTEGIECKRCKNYSIDIGKDINYRHLCPVCADIVSKQNKH